MMKSERESRTLTIVLSSETGNAARSIKLSRLQTELALIGIPAIIVWGLAATAILLHNAWTEGHSPADLSARAHSLTSLVEGNLTTPKAAIAENNAKETESVTPKHPSASLPETASSKLPSLKDSPSRNSIRIAKKSVKLGEVFLVQASLVSNSDTSQPSLQLEISNQSGDLEEGKLWARVSAVDENDQPLEFLSSFGLKLTPEGRADNPSTGTRYSIRHQRFRTLELHGSKRKIKRFIGMQIGISQEPDGNQVVGSTDF